MTEHKHRRTARIVITGRRLLERAASTALGRLIADLVAAIFLGDDS